MAFKALIAITITTRILIKVMNHVNFLVLQGVSQTLEMRNRPLENLKSLKAFVPRIPLILHKEFVDLMPR